MNYSLETLAYMTKEAVERKQGLANFYKKEAMKQAETDLVEAGKSLKWVHSYTKEAQMCILFFQEITGVDYWDALEKIED